jgi:hypothetical protein
MMGRPFGQRLWLKRNIILLKKVDYCNSKNHQVGDGEYELVSTPHNQNLLGHNLAADATFRTTTFSMANPWPGPATQFGRIEAGMESKSTFLWIIRPFFRFG